MFFNKITSAAVLAAGVASALPQGNLPITPVPMPTPVEPTPGISPTPTPTPGAGADGPYFFNIIALRSGSDIHFGHVSASNNGLFLNLKEQDASCDAESDGSATFVLNNTELDLYTGGATPQRVWADRSGMGQGVLGYITGAQPAPSRNSELTGWEIDASGNLSLDGSGLIACPSGNDDGSYRVLVGTGATNPAGYSDCLGFSARTVERKSPNACWYSQAGAQ